MSGWLWNKPNKKEEKDQIALLERKITRMHNMISQENAVIKRYGKTDKNRAMAALKKRNQYSKQLKVFESQQATLIQIQLATDSQESAVLMAGAMKSAADDMKKAAKEMSVDDIHDITLELEDHVLDVNDMNDAITNINFGGDGEITDAELEAELMEGMEEEDFPDVPIHEIRQTEEEEKKEKEEAINV